MEKFVGQYTGLWQAPNCPAHFKVDKTLEGMFVEVVLVNGPFGEQIYRHLHVLKSVQGGGEVKIFDIQTHISGALCAEHTVPHQFGRGEISRPHRQFAGIIYEITPGCDSNAVRVCLLGAKIDDHPCIRDCLARWDVGDLRVSHYENGVSAYLACFAVALSHAAKIFPKCGLPSFARVGIMHKLFITAYGLSRCRMYHRHSGLVKIEA